jgi:hypothetical protein
MVKNKKILAAYKMLFGLLGLSAVVTEIVVIVERGRFVPANFFSFFTIESNIFAAAVLVISAVLVLRGKTVRHFDLVRGAAALYMVTTGIIFGALLSNLDPGVLTAVPWDNTVLHYIMPIVLALDWILDPPTGRIAFRRAAIWLIYPAVYVVYSLVRGGMTGWYPYPFLNPATAGYRGVLMTSIGITVTILAFTWLLVGLQNARNRIRRKS